MTNYEATAYARIALLNLLEAKCDITPDTLFYEMNSLFDLYDEETIVKEVYLDYKINIIQRDFYLSE